MFIHNDGQEVGLVANDWDPSADFVKVKPGSIMTLSLSRIVKVGELKLVGIRL